MGKGVDETGRRSQMARDSGLFGGIGGDDNSLVDNEFDYKKHSVKDLAQHFALVKPKAQLPNQILPEQKMFNGEQGPALNYLGGKQDFASQQQIFTKKEVSNEDIEASKKAYELKKKQQIEQQPDFKLSGDEGEEDGGGEGRAEREETSLHLFGTVDGPRGRARRGRPY